MDYGRPTLYTEELIEKCNDYLDNWKEMGEAWPSHTGLRLHIGISKATLYLWAKDADKKDFLDILDKILGIQEVIAWSKGVKNEYNANLVKLLLGKHGYKDQVSNELTGADGNPIAFNNKNVTDKVLSMLTMEQLEALKESGDLE